MPKNFWWFVSLLTLIALIVLAGLYAKEQQKGLAQAQVELNDAKKAAEETRAQAERLLAGLEESKGQIEKLMAEKEEVSRAQKDLEAQMRAALESKDVTISELQGKLTVNILDRILFDSGEAVLKPEGMAVLDQIAKVLENYPNRQIQVVGHTDNVPIRWRPGGVFQTNWELSAGRAIAAVRYLSEKSGVDPRRLGAVGFGEYHPIADNSTVEGRAKNRRIALIAAPEELLATDFLSATNGVGAGSTNGVIATSTNSPAAETPAPTPETKPEPEKL